MDKALKEKYSAKVLGFIDDKNRIPEIDILLTDKEIWDKDNFKFRVCY